MFAKKGAKIIVNYIHDEENARRVVKEIVSNNGDAIMIKADVSDPNEVKHLFKEIVQQYKKIDILINNAGFAKKISLFDITEENLISEFKENFFSMVYCAQEAAKIMLKHKSGSIINISSICGISGCTTVLPFSCARSALNGFTRALAKTLAPYVTVNSIAPGFTKTRFWDGISEIDEAKLLETTLTKKWITPEEIAQTCYMIVNNNSITGQIITVDGGYTSVI